MSSLHVLPNVAKVTRTLEKRPFVVTHARTVGLLLLLPVPLAFSGALAARLIVPDDPVTTASNILASESLFRLGIVGTLLLMVVDAFVAVVVFYRLLEPVDRHLAMLMVVLNLLGVPITMLNELNQFAVLSVLHGAESSHAFTPDQTGASISLFSSLHDSGSLIAGFFWGLWLVPYAMLVFRSGFLPRLLGVLVIIECFGFVAHSLGGILLPNLGADLALLPAITSLAELFLPVWLIVKGIDVEQWDRHALARV